MRIRIIDTPFFILISIANLLFLSACDNPFLPKSGGLREEVVESPREVISLLQESYERRDIIQFKTIIYDPQEFGSFVKLDGLDYSFVSLSQNSSYINSVAGVPFDSLLALIDGNYATLSYDDEVRIHTKLFGQSDDIRFKTSLLVDRVDYFVTAESDSFALVQTVGDSLVVSSPVIPGGVGSFAVEGQVFCMRKDSDGNWKIWKWFEVN